MKRAAGSDFSEDGTRWFQSPHYKELKTDTTTDELSQAKDASKRFSNDYEKETKLTRERFYDIFTRITHDGNFKLDIEELNRNLNIRIEEVPDNYKISSIFEELNSKSSVMSRGKKNWSEHETLLLIWLVFAYSALNDRDYNDLNDQDWEVLSRAFPGKNSEQCKVRWQGLLKTNLTKAPWTQEEDKLLTDIIKEKGPKKWKEIACELNKKMESHKTFRQGKQCRERWINHLDPTVNRGAWSSEEDFKLLEAHVQIGKKWAEIAKILKNRTENAVKNRWNSLIKKYRGEFGMDIDMFSNSSANSNKSMDDLEKKIAEMILTTKRKGKRDGCSDLLNDQILEVAEEDSPTNCSEISIETSITKAEAKKDDENDARFNQKKGGMMPSISLGKKKPASVLAAKNNLRDLVTEEMHTHSQTQTFQQPKSANGLGDNQYLGQLDQNVDNHAQKVYMFERPNGLNGNHQDVMSGQTYNSAPMPLMNHQHISDPRNSMFNMSNDMLGYNMWRNNLSNLNVLNQNTQQSNLSTNFMGLYNDGNLLQQPNYNVSSSTLPAEQHQVKYASSYPSQNYENENKAAAKSFKLADKTLEQLNISESEQSNFYYAVVDVSKGNIYLMDQVTKENYPPPFDQNKFKTNLPSLPNPPVNNTMEISGSPALNYTTWASPTLNTNALLNYPLFNNALSSLSFAKAQFSPNLNFYQESPKFDTSFFGSTPKMEARSNEWTPENMNRPLLSGLGIKQRIGLANSRGDTPPEMKFGTAKGAFSIRANEKGRGLPGAVVEGIKYSSPSSFLQTGQSSHINRNILHAGLEKI